MTKKNLKGASSKSGDSSKIVKWGPGNILDVNDNNMSTIKVRKFKEVLSMFNDETAKGEILHPSVRADWIRKDWVCFYSYPFDIGMRFPFTHIVENTIKALDMSPAQLMLSVWRILTCLDAIEVKHNLNVDVETIKCAYTIKKFNGCRYGFVSRKSDESLILNLEIVHDQGWRNDFFFVDKTTLSGSTNYLRESWNGEGTSPHFFFSLLFVRNHVVR